MHVTNVTDTAEEGVMIGTAAQAQEDEWITERELLRRLRYSRSTIRRLRVRGLPCVGKERLRRYHWSTVLRWLAEHA